MKKQAEHTVWKDASQTHFHRWAEHYDRDIINVLLFIPSYRRVLGQLRQWRREGLDSFRLLDIGCGTGSLAVQCVSQFAEMKYFAGLDMSENMIAKGQEKIRKLGMADKIRFTVGDAENLPFQDKSFNIITCCNSFHHYPHKIRAVQEMHRVLEENGRLILIDGCRDDPWGYFIFEVCVSYVENHVYHCTQKHFQELLTEAGFRDIKQRVFGVCPPTLINIARAGRLA